MTKAKKNAKPVPFTKLSDQDQTNIYSPKKKEAKEMLALIEKLLKSKGFDCEISKGAFHPTLGVFVARKRPLNYTCFEISISDM